MKRLALAAVLAMLVALVFAPAAVAQMNNDDMMEDEMMGSASAMSSASASAMGSSSAMGSASASAMMDEEMMSASASASPLPRTGGTPIMPLLSAAALAMMAGSGILASRLVRRGA